MWEREERIAYVPTAPAAAAVLLVLSASHPIVRLID
jgi:hypothetical protein